MKPLKFELVNGYGVLVDEEEEIIAGDLILWNGKVKTAIDTEYIHPSHKIIFAEPELNLEGVPVFEWRNFELEKLISNKIDQRFNKSDGYHKTVYSEAFIEGYKSNPAKYTEEDLRKAIQLTLIDAEKSVMWSDIYHHHLSNKIIQSLQKYPKYVVMESEEKEVKVYDNSGGHPGGHWEIFNSTKLFTNSEGKQQGTVKELIWE
jgi:hypothetical protein